MPMNEYRYNGGTYQFEDEDAPVGAERIEQAETKARAPKNKAVKPTAKSGE